MNYEQQRDANLKRIKNFGRVLTISGSFILGLTFGLGLSGHSRFRLILAAAFIVAGTAARIYAWGQQPS